MEVSGDPQVDLVWACWDFDCEAMTHALEHGVRVNAKDEHGRPVWAHLLTQCTEDMLAVQVKAFRLLLDHGLSLAGGGKTVKGVSMINQLAYLPSILAMELIRKHGKEAVLNRLQSITEKQTVKTDWWGACFAEYDRLELEVHTISNSTPKKARPRL